MTRDRRSKRVPTISREVRSLFLLFLLYFVFLKRQKNHDSCLSSLMRFVNRLSRQTKENRLSRHSKSVSFLKNICAMESQKKSLISFLLAKVGLRITIFKFQVEQKIWHTRTKNVDVCFWYTGPRLLAFLRPGSAGVWRGEKASINIFCTGLPDFLFYLEFRNGDPEIHLYKQKGNQTFF